MRRPALTLALALGACGTGEAPTPAAPPPKATTDVGAVDSVTVSIEGMEERIAVRPVRYADLPAPFETVVPASWTDEVSRDGDRTTVRFSTGEPSPATLSVLFVPSGVEAAIEAARATTLGTDDVRPLEFTEPWVRFGRSFVAGGAAGSVRVGEHDGAAFVVREAVPFERGDGFYPRAALVLDRLRWLDTGAGL